MGLLHLAWIAAAIAAVNVPFGWWRSTTRQFSRDWFLAVHLPVPLAIGIRVLGHEGFHWRTLPVFVAAYFAGQLAGARLRGRFGATLLLLLACSATGRAQDPSPLPPPTGPFPVALVTEPWVDSARVPSRPLLAYVWYPARDAGGRRAPYIPRVSSLRTLFGDSLTDALSRVRPHARDGGDMRPGLAPAPVVLLTHGSGMVTGFYASIAEELASHGFVVVGVDSPGDALFVRLASGVVMPAFDGGPPPGDSVARRAFARQRSEARAADLLATFEHVRLRREAPWAGRLDTLHLAAMGHSSGGAAAVLAAGRDPRVDAVATLDSRVTWASPTAARYLALSRPEAVPRGDALLALAGARGHRVVIDATTHLHFGDEILLKASPTAWPAAARATASIREALLAFLAAAPAP